MPTYRYHTQETCRSRNGIVKVRADARDVVSVRPYIPAISSDLLLVILFQADVN